MVNIVQYGNMSPFGYKTYYYKMFMPNDYSLDIFSNKIKICDQMDWNLYRKSYQYTPHVFYKLYINI